MLGKVRLQHSCAGQIREQSGEMPIVAAPPRYARMPGLTLRQVDVNGQPGALVLDGDGRVVSVMALQIADGEIKGVSSIVNPDKLQHLGPVADLSALLRDRS